MVGLHLAGDTAGTNRLIDILLSDTVPVITADRQYDILPPFFPWKQMSVFAPVWNNKTYFLSALAKAPVSTVAEFNAKHYIADKLDWRNNYMFEQYMRSVSLFLSLPRSQFLHAINMSSPHFDDSVTNPISSSFNSFRASTNVFEHRSSNVSKRRYRLCKGEQTCYFDF